MAKGNFATILLRLCIHLNAKEGGLSVLKPLAMDLSEEFQFGGIFKEEMAESTSDFVKQFAGII